MKPLLLILILLIFNLHLLGCTSSGKDKFNNLSETAIYEKAQSHLRRSDYILATEALQQLEADFPFGKYANSAQLALIYAYFKSDEPLLADSAAARYIRLHPNHPNVDYAYYMRGLINFPKPTTLFQSALGTDLSKRDMETTRSSFVYFSELTRLFPESQYAPDAIKRMEYLRNLLARHEINVANYYLDRGAYLAAANRGRYVIENFQKSPAVPDALAIMIQSYQSLQMTDLSQQSLVILRQNFPSYAAFNEKGEFNYSFYRRKTKSLIGTLTFGLIDFSRPPGFDNRIH